MCKRVWRIAQDCAKKQGLVAGSRGWLAACKPPECCTRAKHAKSWRVAPASPRLARPFALGLNSRLNPIARSSRQNTLFGKNWLFTFLLTLLYIYPLFGGLFLMPSHVWSVGGIILLGPGSFWGVASGTQHWATWSNGYWRIFQAYKIIKAKV